MGRIIENTVTCVSGTKYVYRSKTRFKKADLNSKPQKPTDGFSRQITFLSFFGRFTIHILKMWALQKEVRLKQYPKKVNTEYKRLKGIINISGYQRKIQRRSWEIRTIKWNCNLKLFL